MYQRPCRDRIFSRIWASDPFTSARPLAGCFPFSRRLRIEPLEDRRLLARVTVSNLNDVVKGNVVAGLFAVGQPFQDATSTRCGELTFVRCKSG